MLHTINKAKEYQYRSDTQAVTTSQVVTLNI